MSTKYFSVPGFKPAQYNDLEAGEPLYPGIGATEQVLRMGFIQKVFGIVSIQLLLTATVAIGIINSPGAQQFLARSFWVPMLLMIASIAGLIPLYIYKDKHPINLMVLGVWTSIFGVTVGISCSFYAPVIVAQAIFITAAVVGALTVYTFWATRKGIEFTWLAPLLFSGLWALIIWGFIQIFFHPGPISQMIYSLLGALIFCGYIVFDVHLLATRYDVDEYIWGSVALYLDIINLFMHILRIVGQAQDNR
jgi:FtsH-binding integral membrane protein